MGVQLDLDALAIQQAKVSVFTVHWLLSNWIKLLTDRWCQHDVTETTVQLDERFCDVGAFDHSEAFTSLNADRVLSQHLNSHQTYAVMTLFHGSMHYSNTKPDPRTKSVLEYVVSRY